MRKPEQRLWDAMRRAQPVLTWAQRVENVVADGMPDVWLAPDTWIELKTVVTPKKEGTPFLSSSKLRPSQVNWHMKAARHAVRSFILVRDETGVMYLLSGRSAGYANKLLKNGFVAECVTHGGWDQIWRYLRGVK